MKLSISAKFLYQLISYLNIILSKVPLRALTFANFIYRINLKLNLKVNFLNLTLINKMLTFKLKINLQIVFLTGRRYTWPQYAIGERLHGTEKGSQGYKAEKVLVLGPPLIRNQPRQIPWCLGVLSSTKWGDCMRSFIKSLPTLNYDAVP